MKGSVFLMFAVLTLLVGCLSRHYALVREDAVHLYLERPNAKVVYFASSLDGFELHQTKRINERTWEATLPAHIEFSYFYIVDDVVYVPPCRFREKDDYGATNCIYVPGM
jgi:hypothetical protein